MGVTIAALPSVADAAVSPQRNGPAAERQLFDYFVQLHLDAATRPAERLANPVAITDEVLSRLRNVITAAGHYDAMSKSRSLGAGGTSFDEPMPDLHPGPAAQAMGLEDGDASATFESALASLRRSDESVLDMVRFSVLERLVATGFLGMTHHLNTLLKGQ